MQMKSSIFMTEINLLKYIRVRRSEIHCMQGTHHVTDTNILTKAISIVQMCIFEMYSDFI
jgi:hypothetical protein